MPNSDFESFDEIDGEILRVLAENPRTPYSEITEILAETGHEMSPEGVRYRVDKIIDLTTVFFLLDPQDLSWEIIRIAVTSEGTEDAKRKSFELLCDLPFWHVSQGIGTFDHFAVGSVPSILKADELVTTVSEADCVQSVDYLLVTDRNQNMAQYLNMDYLTLPDE
ncbi:MAG: Lrp/AsnC family transcriptional regulator [Halobacteriota archaeon]